MEVDTKTYLIYSVNYKQLNEKIDRYINIFMINEVGVGGVEKGKMEADREIYLNDKQVNKKQIDE